MKTVQFLFSVLIFILPFAGFAQSKDDEAIVLYQRAEQQYENKQYMDCEGSLRKIHDTFGAWNVKVLYLYIKNVQNGIQDGIYLNNYSNALLLHNAVDSFFSIVKENYPHEKYQEMVGIKIDLDDKMKIFKYKRNKYLDLKQRETAFIKDTIDVYAQQFVNDFNEGLKKQPSNKYVVNETWGRPEKLEYEPGNHFIKVYDSRNAKAWHEISLLRPIVFHEHNPNQNYLLLDVIYFLTTKEKNSDQYKQVATYGSDHSIHYKYTSADFRTKTWSYDLTPYLTKLQELKDIMDKTGFTLYYDDGFDDVKN